MTLSSEYIADHSEVIWSFSPMTKPNQFPTHKTYWLDIRLLRIVQSDKSTASWTITQELGFCQIQNLVWEVTVCTPPIHFPPFQNEEGGGLTEPQL